MRILVFDGRLGKDAEVKTSTKNADVKYLTFSVANSTFIRGEEVTTWYNVTTFNTNLIEKLADKLKKGSYVCITTGTYETKISNSSDGRIFINHSVLADRIDYMGSGKKTEDGASSSTSVKAEEEVSIPVTAPKPAAPQVAEPTVSATAPVTDTVTDASDEDDLPF